jgi:protein-S-isoprenylcysteine O-methyltransferase Ste14
MHSVPDLIVVYSFVVMGFGFAIAIFRILTTQGSLWGNPSIKPFLFYSGKITMFICWGLSLIHAIIPSFGCGAVPSWISWLGACMLSAGTVILLLSFYGLGSSLRYGIPENDTQLKTSGLYRFSRHPMYLGVSVINLSCIIFFPNILNILIGSYCIAMHYLMVSAEEKFLAERFGIQWEDYKKKVRRYL